MYNYEDHKEFFNKPIWYNPKVDTPEVVVDDFFSDYSLVDMREILWDLFQVAITSENETYSTARARANLLYRCIRIEKLFEASYILNQRYKMEK